MDKEILRIVIIATGLLVVMGMLIWGYLKDRKSHDEMEFYEDPEPFEEHLNYDDDIDVVPLNSGHSKVINEYYEDDDDEPYSPELDHIDHAPTRPVAPDIIQFCIISKTDEGFNGLDLAHAFHKVGLQYGKLKIFERLDSKRLVDFGVACMVEPGTFPNNNLDSFYCPGIVFFMQPAALDDALTVYDDYIDTIQTIAEDLDGEIWDHQRQILTEETIHAIRRSL